MTLAEIKKQVASFFPGKAKAWISGKVKEMTNGADLRKKATWQYALDLLRANAIEPMPSLKLESAIVESVKVNFVDVLLAEEKLNKLPLKEIRPGFFIVDHFALYQQSA